MEGGVSPSLWLSGVEVVMYQGTIDFISNNTSIDIDGFELSVGKDGLSSIVFSRKDGNILVKCIVEFDNIDNFNEFVTSCKEYCEKIVNRICFYFSSRMRKLEYFGNNIKDKSGVVVDLRIMKSIIAASSWRIGIAKEDPEFVHYVHDEDIKRNYFYKIYRVSIESDDKIYKFVMLYNILLQLGGDCQEGADRLLENIYPNIPIYQSGNPKSKNKKESLFTKIRNELAHARPGVEIETTLIDLSRNIGLFQSLVHRLIEQL